MRELRFEIESDFDGKQALSLLKHIGCSGRIITRLKQGDGLRINGVKARTVDFLRCGDVVEIKMSDEKTPLANEALEVEICYDDADVAVLNKPPFMPIHESINHYNDTLANFFAAKYPDCSYRVINRLDRNTSGLCVAAKNQLAASRLGGARGNMPQKTYYAVVSGKIEMDGEIIAPIARVNDSVIEREVRSDGQYAHTVFRVIGSCNEASLLEITLKTGRTHQIRVHFSHIGHPLLGDELYGGDLSCINRHALHCGKISFIHPISGEKISAAADLPDDMRQLAERLGLPDTVLP